MNTAFDRLARHAGFEPARLAFTLRTALGAGIALLLGGALGLDHPQWAAMTVWIAAQPLRGQLVEKSLFRLIGTAAGTLYGVLLVAVSGGSPAMLAPGVALWVGLCAGAGQLLRGFASYSTLLAGYSAAMVVLLDTGHPDQVLTLGLDRLLTVLLGVAVAMAVSGGFARAEDPKATAARVREQVAQRLRDLATWVRSGEMPGPVERHAQLAELARIEEGLELALAGRIGGRRQVRALRQALTVQVDLLLWWQQGPARGPATPCEPWAAALEAAADAVNRTDGAEPVQAPLALAQHFAAHDPTLADALHRLCDATAQLREQGGAPPLVRSATGLSGPVLHRDWAAAREAFARTAGVLLLVGLLWLATGWRAAPLLMVGVSVMTTLFSTADNPARLMRTVFAGQLMGACAALGVAGLLWPLAQDATGRLLLCLPMLILGAGVMAHPRTARFGFDYNLVGLLLLQPMHPHAFELTQALGDAAGVATGPLVALLAFRWIFPPGGRRRFEQLLRQMQAEVAAMAATAVHAPGTPARQAVWRARLQHRLLRLVLWSEKAGLPPGRAAREGLAVLAAGQAVIALQRVLAQPGLPPSARRRAQALLQRLARPAARPAEQARQLQALQRGARHPWQMPGVDMAALQRAGQALASARAS